jgi:hypothetical protein
MQKVPALRGRLSFSPYISKTFQICPTLSVNFKNGPSFDFFDDVSLILPYVTDDWASWMMSHSNNTLNGRKYPFAY